MCIILDNRLPSNPFLRDNDQVSSCATIPSAFLNHVSRLQSELQIP